MTYLRCLEVSRILAVGAAVYGCVVLISIEYGVGNTKFRLVYIGNIIQVSGLDIKQLFIHSFAVNVVRK